jgi:iron complex outermembrane receptor protein
MKLMPILALTLVNASTFCYAKSEQNTRNDGIEEILVTVPFQRKKSETAIPITAINGEGLRNSAAATLGSTLDSSPGLASASFGPGVGQPVIRGQQGPRVAVLQNSLLVGDASSISADHGVAAEPLLAESIEILRGPSTLLFGGGAIGGVVNVIDQRIPLAVKETTGAAELRHGSVDDELTGVLRVDARAAQFGFHLDALKRNTDDLGIPGSAITADGEAGVFSEVEGIIPNTSSEQQALTLGASYILPAGALGIAASQIEKQYGIPPSADSEEENIRIDMKKDRLDLQFSFGELPTFISDIDWKMSFSDYQHQELEGTEIGTVFKNELWQNRVELSHKPVVGLTGIMGLQQSTSDFSAVGEESFIPPSETNKLGIFLIESIQKDKTFLEFGLRVDDEKIATEEPRFSSKSFTSLSGSASVLWHFVEKMQLGTAFSHSERAPVVEELLSNLDGEATGDFVVHAATNSIEVGNIGLQTEKSTNLDVSLSWDFEDIEGQVSAFYNDFSDYIYLNNTGLEQDETPILNYQQAAAKFSGVEFDINIGLHENLDWRLFGDAITGELSSGNSVPRLPPKRIGTELEFNYGLWDGSINVMYGFKQSNTAPFESVTKGWTRVDTSLRYHIDTVQGSAVLFIRLKNITDEEIRNSVSFLKNIAPEPGRSAELGLRFYW